MVGTEANGGAADCLWAGEPVRARESESGSTVDLARPVQVVRRVQGTIRPVVCHQSLTMTEETSSFLGAG